MRRFEVCRPGKLLRQDHNKLGRIPDVGGHRVLGRPAAPNAHRGSGWFQARLVAICSRGAFPISHNISRSDPTKDAPAGVVPVMTEMTAEQLSVPETADQFARWAEPHLRSMSLLASRLSTAADRDDVVQEALARAWRKRKSFNPDRGTAAAWLLAITADQARRSRRRRKPLLAMLPGHVDPVDDRLDVAAAVRRLTHRQRLAVELVYFIGLSVFETAHVMHCSEGTVKSTLSDARNRLRSLLEVSDGSH